VSLDVLLAQTVLDGRSWLSRHPELAGVDVVTPGSLRALDGRVVGRIYETTGAKDHRHYAAARATLERGQRRAGGSR
jgi:hypothetical protein